MTSESLPARKPRTRPAAAPPPGTPPPEAVGVLRWLDALTLVAFLGLTFLLGAFPLKDTDFWWHLRTGDLIRQTGSVPRVDTFTYGAEGKPWIDLHWIYQVAISWGYQHGGVPALTLAKCVISTLAVLLLVTARRREWPLWAVLTAWLPALLLLGGRMYIRPETLTLLYLASFLAVLTRLDRAPAPALALPVVQVFWVNSQGLFVFGPVLFGAALVDAALRPGAFAPGRRRWWRLTGAAFVLTGLACLVNPYGVAGALYPVQLARTMSTPLFSRTIAELTPIPEFIARNGWVSLMLWIHAGTMALGALSFLVPLIWLVATRARTTTVPATVPAKAGKGKRGGRATTPTPAAAAEPLWRLSFFRLFLFLAFSALSWRATRNSHQFAAVVGAVTAWNLAEWAAAVRRRAWETRGADAPAFRPGAGVVPRLVALAAVLGVFASVATGGYYAAAREGRTIGLGEQPLWFPHDAVKFAGRDGFPPRFLAFHIGHAPLYEYEFGPERKVYADARLEVIGPELYERYLDLQRRIGQNEPGWSRELDAQGRPVVLIDHESSAAVGATLLTSPDWRCVWFDPVAAVFAHVAYGDVVASHAVDFGERHFRPEPSTVPSGTEALLASARGLRNLGGLVTRAGHERAMPLILLGMDHARRAGLAEPDRAEPWRLLGVFETLREPPLVVPAPRFRLPFDPVFDLSAVRATYAFRRALEADPRDFMSSLMLASLYEGRAMTEARVPELERLVSLTPINPIQTVERAKAEAALPAARAALGPAPPATWQNLSQLDRIVSGFLREGRAATAADYLERAAPAASRSWEEADRIAVLRLHLGEPARARAAWENHPSPPRPAVRDARVAVTHMVEGSTEPARRAFLAALAAEPDLFEARYGLAVLEQDLGRAADALAAARRAVAAAPNDVARSAAQAVVAVVTPYATPPLADTPR